MRSAHNNMVNQREGALKGDKLCQVDFVSPEGRRERLWGEVAGANGVRMLSVPVWVYGVSVDTIVKTFAAERDVRQFAGVLRESPGATVRVLAASGQSGRDVYLRRMVPDAAAHNWCMGPATFFGPRLVAFNVCDRNILWPQIADYLDRLKSDGLIEQWELADPDQGDEPDASLSTIPSSEKILIHPLPVDTSSDQEVS